MRICILFILLIGFNSVNGQTDTTKSVITNSSFNIPGYLKINLGFNSLADADESMDTKLFPSRSFDIYYSKPFFIGTNFSINPGLGFSSDKLSFTNDVILSEVLDDDGINQIIVDSLSFSPLKNSLKSTYLIIPIDFKYYFGSGDFDKGRFFVGIGAEIGFLINSSTKVKQKVNNVMNHSKIKRDFGLNDLKYGFSLQLGSGNFNIFYKIYLSNLFKDDSLPLYTSLNPTLNKFGISFSVF